MPLAGSLKYCSGLDLKKTANHLISNLKGFEIRLIQLSIDAHIRKFLLDIDIRLLHQVHTFAGLFIGHGARGLNLFCLNLNASRL